MKKFSDIVKKYSKEYPLATQVCLKAIREEKSKIKGDITEQQRKFLDTPKNGLFGEDLHEPIHNKIKELQIKLEQL